ncbi:MAG: hypothetical protein J6A83_03980 [Clostridia bacterium]|nr:hypothetical protein [Clostridia bacterium]
MKTDVMKKLFSVLLCVALLCPPIILATFAEDGESKDTEYVDWTLSENEAVLSNETKTYNRYNVLGVSVNAKEIYRYKNSVEASYAIQAPSADSEFVWLSDQTIYATDAGKIYLDAFLREENVSYRLFDENGRQTNIKQSTVERLDSLNTAAKTQTLTVEVRELLPLTRYDITVHDQTETLAFTHGAVYEFLDGSLYYINYTLLGNQHFDAYGSFSYRRGTVTLAKLDDTLATAILGAAAETDYIDTTYIYEDDISESSETVTLVIFWIAFILLGFVLPIPFLVLGLMIPRAKKLGQPKHWYVIAAIAGAWILFAAITALLLIIV